jgi:hypothetical protein
MNSDNSEHCFYIVCKCLSSIIYYDFYMHKVDFLFISKLIVNQSKSMYLSQVSSCLSPKILYLPWKCNIKTFEINIKIYILHFVVACFIVFIQSRVLMNLKPYSEPCFRHFSDSAIIDVCTFITLILHLQDIEIVELFTSFHSLVYRVLIWNDAMSSEKYSKSFD